MKLPRLRTAIRPSTIAFLVEGLRTPGYSFLDWLHGTVYARWPYLYIGIGVGEHPLAKHYGPLVERLVKRLPRRSKGTETSSQIGDSGSHMGFAASYHGKVVPLEKARQLVMVNEDVRLPDLEKIIPYPRARNLILKNPDHIVALQCPCRTARANPCLPLDVCLVVGEPFASYVSEHHPQRSRWISPQEATEILEAEHERGHVHHAFFKDAMLGRFYAICNCCACCCGAMQSQRRGTPMLASSGYIAVVDEALCIGCGECESTCQFGALGVANYINQVDVESCLGCGVCVDQCEQGAMSLVRDASKGEPLDILELMAKVR